MYGEDALSARIGLGIHYYRIMGYEIDATLSRIQLCILV